MLCHRHAGACHDKGCCRRDVVGADSVTARADNVHGAVRRVDDGCLFAHHGSGGRNVFDAFAAHLQCGQERRHLDLADFAVHDGVETGADVVGGGHLAFGQHLQRRAHHCCHCRASRLCAGTGPAGREDGGGRCPPTPPDYMEAALPWQASRPAAESRKLRRPVRQHRIAFIAAPAPILCRAPAGFCNDFAFFRPGVISACAGRRSG